MNARRLSVCVLKGILFSLLATSSVLAATPDRIEGVPVSPELLMVHPARPGEYLKVSVPGRMPDADLYGVFLPVAPSENQLPGLEEVWADLAERYRPGRWPASRDGFDAIQAMPKVLSNLSLSTFSAQLPGRPEDIALRGETAYLLCAPGKWIRLDLSVPERPVIRDVTPAKARLLSMAVSADQAFLLTATGQVLVMDLSDPDAPRELKRFQAPKGTRNLHLVENRLIMGDDARDSKLSPLSGQRLDQELPAGEDVWSLPLLRRLKISMQTMLYQAGTRRGVRVLDLSSLAEIRELPSIAIPDNLRKLAASDDHLYAWGQRQMLYRVDLMSADRGVEEYAAGYQSSGVYLMFVGEYVYAFSQLHGLQVYAIPWLNLGEHVASHKKWSGGYLLRGTTAQNSARLSFDGQKVSSGSGGGGEQIVLPGEGDISAASWFGQDLLVLDRAGQLRHFRRQTGGGWLQIRTLQFSDRFCWLVTHDDQVMLGGDSSVLLIGRSAEGHLMVRDRLLLSVSRTLGAVMSGTTLLVAAGSDGALMVNVEPETLSYVGNLDSMLPRMVRDRLDVHSLAIDGADVALAAGRAGVLFGELKPRGGFQLLAVQPLDDPVVAVTHSGGYWLAATPGGVEVITLSNEFALQRLGTIRMHGVKRLHSISETHWLAQDNEQHWTMVPAPVAARSSQERVGQILVMTTVPISEGVYRLTLYGRDGVVPVSDYIEVYSGT